MRDLRDPASAGDDVSVLVHDRQQVTVRRNDHRADIWRDQLRATHGLGGDAVMSPLPLQCVNTVYSSGERQNHTIHFCEA